MLCFVADIDIAIIVCYTMIAKSNSLANTIQIYIEEKKMEDKTEGMTDEEFQIFLKMVIMILEGCDTVDEAIEKFKNLLK